MKKVERDLQLEQKTIEMLKSKDKEMIDLGMTILINYFDSYKKFKLYKEQYFPEVKMRIWGSNYQKVHNPIIPKWIQIALYNAAKMNESKRRDFAPHKMRNRYERPEPGKEDIGDVKI